jgi:PKD repeat protein
VTGYDVTVHYGVERFFADGAVTVYKDGAVFDTITLTGFKGTGVANYNVAPDDLGAHNWSAVLEVTGGGITTQASDSDAGMVYATPNVADIPDQMSPFETFDLDDYQTCQGDYDVDWSVSGVPTDWTVDIDTEHVVTVTAPEGAVTPATLTFAAVFHWPGIDCDGSDDATFSPNQPPVAHAGMVYPDEKYEVYEGGAVMLDGTASYDPDGDPITFAWDFDSDGVFETPGATPVFSAATLDWPETDEVYIHLMVCDPYGACDITVAEVEIEDLAPTADFTWTPEPQDEGAMVAFTDLSTSPVDDIVAWNWSFAGLGTDTAQDPNFTFYDNGVYSVCLTVTDDDGSTDMVCYDVTILNVSPTIDALTAPTDPVSIDDAPYTVMVDFSDPGTLDTHDVVWDWGDGLSDTQTGVTSPASASHTYAEAGVYPVQVTVMDDGGMDTQTYQYIVVYDPSSGFVTGGGWIMSPEGAYAADPTLTGKANFGFNAKYKKGANTPDGQTEFHFQVADFNFHSTEYDWLVVAGAKAKFKGTGTINGEGNYGFMLTATDSAINGGGDVDGFRIKIWVETCSAPTPGLPGQGAKTPGGAKISSENF